MDNNIVEISPVPLNKGERLFVEDIKAYHDNSGISSPTRNSTYSAISVRAGRRILRAGNFHPDFIVWLLVGGRQYVIFVDPRASKYPPVRCQDQFYATVKEIEQRLGDPDVHLESFIISNTPSTR